MSRAKWGLLQSLVVAIFGVLTAGGALLVAVGGDRWKWVGAAIAVLSAVALLLFAVPAFRAGWSSERTKSRARLRHPPVAVAEIEPTSIGVDPADEQFSATIQLGGNTPRYVHRSPADELLRDAITAATGKPPGQRVILVEGSSKVGKSRTLLHALSAHETTRSWLLVAPTGAASLTSILEPGESAIQPDDPAVLWLDDLEPFIGEGLKFETVERWLDSGPHRIAACTLGGKGGGWDAARARDLAPTVEAFLLRSARVVMRKSRLQELENDPELARGIPTLPEAERAELELYGFAAYLVAGPLLASAVSTGRMTGDTVPHPAGVAIVRAVADWARCGRTDPMPEVRLRRLWPMYATPAPPFPDQVFEDAVTWACTPVAGSIAMLESVGGYRPFDYIVRLVSQDPGDPVPDEMWAAAIYDATGAQARRVAMSSIESARLGVAMQVLATISDREPDRPTAAWAAFVIGGLSVELGDLTEAVDAFDAMLARFGGDPDPAVRTEAARSTYNKGVALARLGRPQQALATYDEVIANFGTDEAPETRQLVAGALYNKGIQLSEMGKHAEGIAAYEQVYGRFGSDREPDIRLTVAKALFNKAVGHSTDAQRAMAEATYAELATHFADDTDPAVRAEVAAALRNMGLELEESNQLEKALAAFDELLARFREDPSPEVRIQVARALLSRGTVLAKANVADRAVTSFDEVRERFGTDAVDEIREIVVAALLEKALLLDERGDFDQAINAYRDIANRYRNDLSGVVRRGVALALVDEGDLLSRQNRRTEAVVAYDDAATWFEHDASPLVRARAATALLNKVYAVPVLDSPQVLVDLVQRFGEDTSPEVRRVCDEAISLGKRLTEITRQGDAPAE